MREAAARAKATFRTIASSDCCDLNIQSKMRGVEERGVSFGSVGKAYNAYGARDRWTYCKPSASRIGVFAVMLLLLPNRFSGAAAAVGRVGATTAAAMGGGAAEGMGGGKGDAIPVEWAVAVAKFSSNDWRAATEASG